MFPLPPTAMRIFICILIQEVLFDKVSAFNFSTSLGCVQDYAYRFSIPRTEVPKLAEAFSLRMEVKGAGTMLEWGFYDVELYYDKGSQRAAVYYLMNSKKIDVFFDLQNKTVISITDVEKGRVCKSEDYQTSLCNPIKYFLLELAGHSIISEYCRMFVSPAYNVTSSGDIRNIKEQKWEQCVRDGSSNQTFWSTYHFTAPNVVSPSSSISSNIRDETMPVPIHFETRILDGQGKGNSFIYDLTHYIPDVKDKSVLLPGIKCPDPMPKNEINSVTQPTMAPKTTLSMHQPPFEPVPKPFAFVDSIVVRNQSSKYETWKDLLVAWDTVSPPAAVVVHPTMINIEPYTPTLNPLLRKITLLVTGVSPSGSFDEYAFKQKFREYVRSVPSPIPNVYLVPPAEIIPLGASVMEKASLFKVWLSTNTTMPPSSTGR